MTHQPHTSAANTELLPLLEFSSVINSSLDLRFILGTLLLTVMGKLLISKGVVLLKKGKKTFYIENGKGVPKEILRTEFEFPLISKKKISFPDKKYKALQAISSLGINCLYPILSQDTVIGYLGIAEHPQRPVTKEQQKFIDTLINVSAAAIDKGVAFDETKNSNRALDGKIQQLKTLFDLGKEFNGILEQEQLLKMFSLTLMGQVGTNRYAICFKEGKSIYSRIPVDYLEADKHAICELATAPLFTQKIPDKKKYLKLKNHLTKEKIAALIPLELQNEVHGVLCLGERLRKDPYTQGDLEFVYSLANLAFVSLENTRLFQEAVEKRKLESELLIAREIQQGLLPQTLPDVKGFEISGVNISSKQVGGDYYDVIPASDGKFIIVIGDVSGKGTPASLLMANVQATVHALVPVNLSLSEATGRINDLIHRNTSADKFITFFWGALDPLTKIFHYVNAGHNPPFVLRPNGNIERLENGGLILGILKTSIPYEEGNVKLNSGDCVILFTDGVSEAMDVSGHDYTEERLEQFVKGLRHESARVILEKIKNEIQQYALGAPQSDDITLVVFKAL
ncbi:MAG: PP2C family protein-serine/threonine phosphatase [Bacteroidota bacterium]|nr:PP2C family protein-serine/threonine phosphatase [Bacteroidota bacterium]